MKARIEREVAVIMGKTDDTFWKIVKADRAIEDKKIIEGWDKPLPGEKPKGGKK